MKCTSAEEHKPFRSIVCTHILGAWRQGGSGARACVSMHAQVLILCVRPARREDALRCKKILFNFETRAKQTT